MAARWWVYILRCRGGRLYTGITTDVPRRLRQHQQGKGGHFTRAFRPVKLVYAQRAGSESRAKSREVFLKALPRAEKLALLADGVTVAQQILDLLV